jgi:hypothetical protein
VLALLLLPLLRPLSSLLLREQQVMLRCLCRKVCRCCWLLCWHGLMTVPSVLMLCRSLLLHAAVLQLAGDRQDLR